MSADVLSKLEKLNSDSKKKLPEHVRQSLFGKLSPPLQLANVKLVANAHWAATAKKGTASLLQPENRRAVRKVMTLPAGVENNFTYMLNSALLGGESYPVLTTVLGTAAGIVSFGSGLLFAASTTAIGMGQTAQRILARAGDEIWIVEEIGKAGEIGNEKATHVCAFWLCDPYRGQTGTKGWLIHEERKEILLD